MIGRANGYNVVLSDTESKPYNTPPRCRVSDTLKNFVYLTRVLSISISRGKEERNKRRKKKRKKKRKGERRGRDRREKKRKQTIVMFRILLMSQIRCRNSSLKIKKNREKNNS